LLLHIAAEIEHSLMVEYLYAGFALGGPEVKEHKQQVTRWQETILGIAKEEMGHLMTVQNVLRCLGGPLNLDRQDYPWDSAFSPFPYQLEPLTRESLAKYVFAESPPPKEWSGPEAEEIRRLAFGSAGTPVHRVGELYACILKLLSNEEALADTDFRASTYPFQANPDEWGRGYQDGARGNATGTAMSGTPNLILVPVTSRTDAINALTAVATQGEANPTADDTAPSHFARFLAIFRQFPKDDSWVPSRNAPRNPYVTTVDDAGADVRGNPGTPITHPDAALWAHLFNVRYQLLLTNLLRTFEYPSNLSETSTATPRGLLIHSTFGEMYNLRALAMILVQAPLSLAGTDRVAGPPFQMPFTLTLPMDAIDRWRLHLDLLASSATLVRALLSSTSAGNRPYLLALKSADDQVTTMIKALLR
jgi:hypothetical protein